MYLCIDGIMCRQKDGTISGSPAQRRRNRSYVFRAIDPSVELIGLFGKDGVDHTLFVQGASPRSFRALQVI